LKKTLKKLIIRLMKKTYLFLIIIAFIGAVIAALLPEKDYSKKEISPEILQAELNLHSRFFSTDQVADLLINKDPSLLLIDVRNESDYNKYHLPGAINIPLSKLNDSSSLEFLSMDFKNKVFYSNGTTDATAAWMIARRNSFEKIFILEGGLNKWYETIINPVRPEGAEATITALDKYSFRLAASQYFTNKNVSQAAETKKPAAAEKKPVKVTKKNSPGGGC